MTWVYLDNKLNMNQKCDVCLQQLGCSQTHFSLLPTFLCNLGTIFSRIPLDAGHWLCSVDSWRVGREEKQEYQFSPVSCVVWLSFSQTVHGTSQFPAPIVQTWLWTLFLCPRDGNDFLLLLMLPPYLASHSCSTCVTNSFFSSSPCLEVVRWFTFPWLNSD